MNLLKMESKSLLRFGKKWIESDLNWKLKVSKKRHKKPNRLKSKDEIDLSRIVQNLLQYVINYNIIVTTIKVFDKQQRKTKTFIHIFIEMTAVQWDVSISLSLSSHVHALGEAWA